MISANIFKSPYTSTVATTLLITAVTLFQGVILARMLGPEGRGIFFIVTAIPVAIASIGLWGFDSVLAIKTSENARRKYEAFALLISVLTSTVSALVVICIWLFGERPIAAGHIHLQYIFLLFLPINHALINLQAIDRGRSDFKKINFCRLFVNPAFVFGLGYTWIFVDDKIAGAVLSLVFANFMSLIFRVWQIKEFEFWLPAMQEVRDMFNRSLLFGLNSLSFILFSQIDKLLIIQLLNKEQLGQYSTAIGVASASGMVNYAISYVSFSEGMRSNKGGIGGIFKTAGLISILIYVIIVAIVPSLYQYLYGDRFVAGIPVVNILVGSTMIISLANIVAEHAKGGGNASLGILASSVSCLVYGITCFGLHVDSAMDAAYVLLLSSLVYFAWILCGILYLKTMNDRCKK